MSSWITITENDILTRLTGPELTAFTTAAKAAGQESPLPEILAATVDEVRGYVAGCARNKLGAAGTIPPRLKLTTINLIRYRLATRLPNMKSLIDELRQEEYADALTLLRAVSACNFAVEDPAGDATSVPSVGPSFTRPHLNFSRDQQDGI